MRCGMKTGAEGINSLKQYKIQHISGEDNFFILVLSSIITVTAAIKKIKTKHFPQNYLTA